jgi:hypothetical protein
MSKAKDNIIIGYVLMDLQGNCAVWGPACLVFGTEGEANEHKAHFDLPALLSVEPAGFDEIMMVMLTGSPYGFNTGAAEKWNEAIVTHKSRYLPFEEKLGFRPPHVKVPQKGEFEVVGWYSHPVVHQTALKYLMQEKQRDLTRN